MDSKVVFPMWQNQIPICAFCATETRKNTIFTEMLRVLLHNAKIADKYAEFQGKEWVRIPSVTLPNMVF